MADNHSHSSKQQNDQTSAGRNAAEAVHQGAQAAQQSGRATREAMQHAGDATADATRRTSEAGAQAMQRTGDAAGETMQRSAEAFAEGQREFLQKTAEQFEDVSRKVAEAAQGTTENLRTLMTLPNAAQGGLQDLQHSVTGLIEGVVRTNLRAAQEMFHLANPVAIIEMQQRFAHEYLDAFMQGTATLVRATRRTADEMLRPLEQQIEQQRQQAANQGQQSQGYRHAAE